MLLTAAIAPRMIERGGGKIINVTMMAAVALLTKAWPAVPVDAGASLAEAAVLARHANAKVTTATYAVSESVKAKIAGKLVDAWSARNSVVRTVAQTGVITQGASYGPVMRVRTAVLLSGITVGLCGLWFMQTVLWPSGGTATDLRPLWPIIVALVLLSLIWLSTIVSAALDSYHRVVRGEGHEPSERPERKRPT